MGKHKIFSIDKTGKILLYVEMLVVWEYGG